MALDFAHGRGVIHRDVKPANFLLDRDRTLYVGDFGIARVGDEDTITASGEMLGTAAYLAPERVRGRPATDASDRYAMAVVAYELLVGERPFRSPHHTISDAGLIGGGAIPRPGEVSLAHHGVLFMDELAEFSAASLQALRQPLEEGRVTITRALGAVTYPARFQLVAATNPCPCGWLGSEDGRCRCAPTSVEAYRRGISGPLLDRIDLRVNVSRPPLIAMGGAPAGEPSAAVRARVVAARARQLTRQGAVNATLKAAALREHAALGATRPLLARWAAERGLSARGFHRCWRVARSIADLAGRDAIEAEDVLEALGYRIDIAAAA